MLTLSEKNLLGQEGRFIALVRSAIAKAASDVTHEKMSDISFGALYDAELGELPIIQLAQQQSAHVKRAVLAQRIIASAIELNDAAKRAAVLLAAAMAEDVAKENVAMGTAVAELMVMFLHAKPQKPVYTQVETGELDADGNPITETVVDEPESWEADGLLEPAKQAQLDGVLTATIASGWNALAGFNVHYEIPRAIAAAGV